MAANEQIAQLQQAIAAAAENLPSPGDAAPTDPYSQAIAELGGIYPSTVQRFGHTVTQSLAVAALSVPFGQLDNSPAGAAATGLSSIGSAVSSFVGDQPFAVTASGNMVYPNGVVVDPAGQIVTGPWVNDPDVEGSNAWIRNIQESWNDEKFNTWRKRLISMGYDTMVSGGIASKGGMAQDVLEGLRQYHYMRYANGGKPIRITGEERSETIRSQVDFKAVKEDVGSWLDAVGYDRDDDVQEFFAQQVLRRANRLMKTKGWDAQTALTGAELRTQEKFVQQPGVKGELKQMEEDEMDETLRNDAISIMQLGI